MIVIGQTTDNRPPEKPEAASPQLPATPTRDPWMLDGRLVLGGCVVYLAVLLWSRTRV